MCLLPILQLNCYNFTGEFSEFFLYSKYNTFAEYGGKVQGIRSINSRYKVDRGG